MKLNEYISLWKQGVILAFKVYVLAYVVQFIVIIPILLIGLTLNILPAAVGYALAILLAIIFIPFLIGIGAEYLKLGSIKEPQFGFRQNK